MKSTDHKAPRCVVFSRPGCPIPSRPKYPPQYPIRTHPVFLPECEKTSFTPIQNIWGQDSPKLCHQYNTTFADTAMQFVTRVLITKEDLCVLFTRHVHVTSNYGSGIKRAAEIHIHFCIITNKSLTFRRLTSTIVDVPHR